MRVREYQLDKIEDARKIQQECLRLHMPCPPVLHWAYEIKDPNGEVVEKGKGKANSYTRNALNILAYYVGFCAKVNMSATGFIDGLVNIKQTNETIPSVPGSFTRYGANDPLVVVGGSADAESLDSYVEPSTTLTKSTGLSITTFDAATRTLTTTLTRSFINTTGASVDIKESGIVLQVAAAAYALYVRDVFSPVAVANGETIVWTYTTEVAYPNP